MQNLYKGLQFILFFIVSTVTPLFSDFGYQPFLNFSTPNGFQYSSPVSISHSHRVYHPLTPRTNGISNFHGFQELGGPLSRYNSFSFSGPEQLDIKPSLLNDVSPLYNQLPNVYGSSFQPGYNFRGAPPQGCQQPIFGPCKDSKYRTIDGSCNNIRNPGLGVGSTRYGRLIPPKYADDIHQPPNSVTGHPLASSRLVSLILFPDRNIPDPVWTLVSMQWGQIITHDMSMAMGNTQGKRHAHANNANQCCSPNGREFVASHLAPIPCFPIEIPLDDPVYSKYGQTCMNFMRTTTDVDRGCLPAHPHQPQEQIVAVTQYMDASLVYGSTVELANSLREGSGGRLLVTVRNGQQWPPPASNKSATCENQDDDEPCYKFGDVRGNQNPQLTVLQIILLREHNRVADALQHLNPHWNDETIYQEARRIVIAEYQHINYYEWLPIFIGTKNMMQYGLLYNTDGYINDYREDINPSVLNEHATAAFRYFHSAIQGRLHLLSEHRNVKGALRLSDYFNRPGVLEEGDNLDKLTRGMATQNEERVDQFFTSEITDFLFRNGQPFGLDLRAFDIQRGRDHGLASYNDYRQYCGLPKAKTFNDFADYISSENIEKLSLLYKHPDDIDLVVGGSLEAHVKDTLSGPTFLCIMLEQFYRTRTGDRYFYENGNQHGAFTPEQLREIRKASISRLFCDNGDSIQLMQPEGFRVIGPKNPLVHCHDTNSIPAIDLTYWAENVHKNHAFDFNYFIKK